MRSLLAAEELSEKLPCLVAPGFREYNRFRFPNRVGDKSFLMKAIHGIPVEAFPSPPLLMNSEIHQGENCAVDLLCIKFHDASLRREFNGEEAPVGLVRRAQVPGSFKRPLAFFDSCCRTAASVFARPNAHFGRAATGVGSVTGPSLSTQIVCDAKRGREGESAAARMWSA